MRQEAYRPLTQAEMMEKFAVADEDLEEFVKNLYELEASGQIILTRKNRYGLPKQFNLSVGRLEGHAQGFAFLIPDDPNESDVFVKGRDLQGAINNDRVVVRLEKESSKDKKREGKVIRILERANEQIVGTFEMSKFFGFVIPDDQRIGYDFFVGKEEFNGAKDGDKVVLKVKKWPDKRRNPEGEVIAVLGKKGSPGVDIISIIKKHQLPEEFPKEVLKEVEKTPKKVLEKDFANRKDLRDLKMVTIDGLDAKDLDDAVSLEILDNGLYRLGVHIADVAEYVEEGSALDKEAFERGTSVYLVDRVIPMLPKELSNGICSLNAGEDRLAMSCFMEINKSGKIIAHEITESVINVDERMSYDDLYKIVAEEDEEVSLQYKDYLESFKAMKDLALILRQKRLERGAIDFDFPESQVRLDEKGKPVEIYLRSRTIAEQIIEEFMIATNETVAEHYYWLEVPFLYRIHEKPKIEDVSSVNEFLNIFGYNLKGINEEIHPKAFQEVIKEVEDKPEKRVINTVLLRSMQHARYMPDALGHFGLASDYYSHFTAPIRRYPDLSIHRVMKEMLRNGELLTSKRIAKLKKLMAKYADHASLRERIAEEAERESVDLKKVEYMKDYEGEEFSGIISSVTSFGFFVALENSVEGLVHVSTLTDDFYIFDQKSLSLIGENFKKVFQIGKEVKVLIARVDIDARQIDMELVLD